MKTCNLCNINYDDNEIYCKKCGNILIKKVSDNALKTCPKCGRKHSSGLNYCILCYNKQLKKYKKWAIIEGIIIFLIPVIAFLIGLATGQINL